MTGGDSKKTIFFFSTSPNHMRVFHRMNHLLKDDPTYAALDFDILRYAAENSLLFKLKNRFKFLKRIYSRVEKKIWRLRFIFFSGSIIRKSSKILEENNACCIVLCDQYIHLRSVIASKVANKLSIPIVLIPFVNPNLEDILKIRTTNEIVIRESNSVLGRFIRYLFPEWKIKRGNVTALWANPLEILGLKLLGSKLNNPVQGVDPLVDYVFLSGDLAKSRLLECGFSENKIRVIGDLVYDIFHHELANDKEWRLKHGIENKKVLLYSIVPDQRKTTIYGAYEEYLRSYRRLFQLLESAGWKVICNPHPSTKEDAIAFFQNSGFLTLKEDLAMLIPHADLYLTTYSSTLLWASSLRIPSIDQDLYAMGYKGATEVPFVKTVYSPAELEELIKKIVEDPDYLNAWKSSVHNPDYFNAIDGKVVAQITQTISGRLQDA